ncbi:hypothetical protein PAPHI01_0698 [Pancytospora philotis]|nr:hypothetical protein PAPHI01_0698 [Pancytospora philotis]
MHVDAINRQPFMSDPMRRYELVRHPFIVDSREQARLAKIGDGFELRFGTRATSKRVRSSAASEGKNYIELELLDGMLSVIGETDRLSVFEDPADFVVPLSDRSRDFYDELHAVLAGDDLEALCRLAGESTSRPFPEFAVPLTTTSAHAENFKSTAAGKPDKSVRCRVVRFGGEIPSAPPAGLAEYLTGVLGADGYEVQRTALAALFARLPVAKYAQIEGEYLMLPEADRALFRQTYLKKSIGMHCFYYSSGPWRHCWVRFGYDPSAHRENYRHQTLYLENNHRLLQLTQFPEIIDEVERNIDWYVTKVCDPVDGFLSEALRKLIAYRLNVLEQ